MQRNEESNGKEKKTKQKKQRSAIFISNEHMKFQNSSVHGSKAMIGHNRG